MEQADDQQVKDQVAEAGSSVVDAFRLSTSGVQVGQADHQRGYQVVEAVGSFAACCVVGCSRQHQTGCQVGQTSLEHVEGFKEAGCLPTGRVSLGIRQCPLFRLRRRVQE